VPTAVNRTNIVLFRDAHAYCLAPTIVATREGDWLVAFNQSIRRTPTRRHPPSDPLYLNHITRSADQGRTWDYPRVVPGFDFTGVEDPGLMRTADGDILLSVYRRRFLPRETAEKLRDTLLFITFKDPYPWAVTHDATYVHRSADGGRTWIETVRLDTTPFISGYSPKGGVVLDNGDVLLPLAAAVGFADSPWWGQPDPAVRFGNTFGDDGKVRPGKSAVFTVRSRDGGRTWGRAVVAAEDPGLSLVEPCLLALPGSRLLCMFRAGGGTPAAGVAGEGGNEGEAGWLYQCRSADSGQTWNPPERTPIWGFPPHLLLLRDGRILCTYGHRRPPYGIRACLSHDGGVTWDTANEILIRTDFPDRDVGYPSAIQCDDGSVFAVYYGKDPDGITCIQGSYFAV